MANTESLRARILDENLEMVLPFLDCRALDGQRFFITGGTGFFGIWLLSTLRLLHLRDINIDVCVLSRDPEAFLSRHQKFRGQRWLEFVSGNVRDFTLPKRSFDLLVHAATETSMAIHAQPGRMFDDIVLGTRRVLELARSSGVRRVLLVSSGAVYGPQSPEVVHQPDGSATACNPLSAASAYGEGKRVMELLGAILQQESGIECVSARCFAFCGPGLPLDAHFAIGNFIRDALQRKQITVQGNGLAVRSYLHAADLAVWLLTLLSKGEKGQSYNVGSDEALSIKDLAYRVRDVLAPGLPVEILQKIEASQTSRNIYVPSVERARQLGCRPWTSLDESIVQTARHWISER